MITASTCPLCGGTETRCLAPVAQSRLVRCAGCGLAYRDPRPGLEGVRERYERTYQERSWAAHTDDRRRPLFLHFLRRMPLRGRRRLLDVGCGTGEFMKLAQQRGWRVCGLEVSEAAAAQARQSGLDVRDGTHGLPDGGFDVATLWNVVDYFPSPLEQLREIHRVLAPGGELILRLPNEGYQLAGYRLSRILRWPRPLARLVEASYFFQPTVWSPRITRRVLLDAGFADIEIANSIATDGDPYRAARGWERLVRLVKTALYVSAQVTYAVSRGRLVIGSSFTARARKPA